MKNFCLQKSVGFIDNKNTNEHVWVKKAFTLVTKINLSLIKFDGLYEQGRLRCFFLYCNVPDDECLFDTLGDTDSDVKSPLKTFCRIKLLPHTSTFILLGINLTS